MFIGIVNQSSATLRSTYYEIEFAIARLLDDLDQENFDVLALHPIGCIFGNNEKIFRSSNREDSTYSAAFHDGLRISFNGSQSAVRDFVNDSGQQLIICRFTQDH